MRRSARATKRLGTEEVVEEDETASGTADPPHLPRHRHRVRHDADDVRRVDEVERIVRKLQARRVHLQEADVAHLVGGEPAGRLLQHLLGHVDARHGDVGRVQRRVYPGADADFEHLVAGLQIEPADGLETPRVQGRSEEPVVDDRDLVVDGLDEGAFDDGRRQRPGLRIGAEVVVGVPPQESHAGDRPAAGASRSAMKKSPTFVDWSAKSRRLYRVGPPAARPPDPAFAIVAGSVPPEARFLTTDQQVLLTTLVVKLAVVATLATMLVRFRQFRRILLTEQRAWRERLVFAFSLGNPPVRRRRRPAAARLRRGGLLAGRPVPRRVDRRPVRRRPRRGARRRAGPAGGRGGGPAVRGRLRVRRRRPAGGLPEGSHLAPVAAVLRGPAPARVAARPKVPRRLAAGPRRGPPSAWRRSGRPSESGSARRSSSSSPSRTRGSARWCCFPPC